MIQPAAPTAKSNLPATAPQQPGTTSGATIPAGFAAFLALNLPAEAGAESIAAAADGPDLVLLSQATLREVGKSAGKASGKILPDRLPEAETNREEPGEDGEEGQDLSQQPTFEPRDKPQLLAMVAAQPTPTNGLAVKLPANGDALGVTVPIQIRSEEPKQNAPSSASHAIDQKGAAPKGEGEPKQALRQSSGTRLDALPQPSSREIPTSPSPATASVATKPATVPADPMSAASDSDDTTAVPHSANKQATRSAASATMVTATESSQATTSSITVRLSKLDAAEAKALSKETPRPAPPSATPAEDIEAVAYKPALRPLAPQQAPGASRPVLTAMGNSAQSARTETAADVTEGASTAVTSVSVVTLQPRTAPAKGFPDTQHPAQTPAQTAASPSNGNAVSQVPAPEGERVPARSETSASAFARKDSSPAAIRQPRESTEPTVRPSGAQPAQAIFDLVPSDAATPRAAELQPLLAMREAQPQASVTASGAPGNVSITPSQTSGHDFAALVDRLVEAREAATPQTVKAAISHAEFGQVSLRFVQDDGRLTVSMNSADPDFAPAVQTALAAGQAPGSGDSGTGSQRQDGTGQQSGGSSSGQSQAQTQQNAQSAGRDGNRQSSQTFASDGDEQVAQPRQGQPGRRDGIYA